ncbi:hypothetical protein [Psittacicella hinzii]|nr:hypothetical protein [Psittacicella hinzii]
MSGKLNLRICTPDNIEVEIVKVGNDYDLYIVEKGDSHERKERKPSF